MKYNKTIFLKDNRECLLRNARGSDAEAVYNNFNLMHEQTDFLLSYPDENSFDVKQERQFLLEKEESINEKLDKPSFSIPDDIEKLVCTIFYLLSLVFFEMTLVS